MRGLKRKNRKPELRQASPEHTRRVLGKIANIRHTYQYLVLYLVLAVLLGHTTTVRASSVEHTGEIKEKPGLSLWKEIRNMQKLQKKKDADETEGKYLKDLLTKSNPELEGVNEYRCVPYIYRVKEYADLDIAKCSIEEIKYKIRFPYGIHSLRILDSSNDEKDRNERNRVFAKLLYSLFRLKFTSLLIENIKIGPEEQELLILLGNRRSTLTADRLVFRNVTTETIEVFFRRFGTISVKRLCIEKCDGVWLNDAVEFGEKDEIDGLELTEVTTLHDYQTFLDRVKNINHLKIYKVEFEFTELLTSFLSRLTGTLEIDRDGYEKMQKEEGWAGCVKQVTHLHLMVIGNAESIEKEFGSASSTFSSLTTLSLSVKHPQLLDSSLLSPIIEYAKKHHKRVSNVIVLGKMNMEDVKNSIYNKKSALYRILCAHKDTHFTFADNTRIDPSRKHLLFIPLSLYNKVSNMELRSRLEVLEEMSNWDWDKQRRFWAVCETCNIKQDVYVTQIKGGRIICDYCITENILGPKTNIEVYKNVQLESTKHLWYPRHVIFLSQKLDGQVYLAETEDLYELMKIKHKAIGTKRPAELIHTTKNSTVCTNTASTGAAEQQQEPQQGSNRHTRECIAQHNYEPSQPPAAKRPRHEPAASNRDIFEQSVMPEAQNADVFGQAVMPQEEELQMDIDTLQMRIDAEVTENPNGPRPQNWMTELLEEPLIPEPAVQEIEQTQALDMLGELQVLTDEEMEELLALL